MSSPPFVLFVSRGFRPQVLLSIDPVEIFICKEGIACFATEPYSPIEIDGSYITEAHITSQSVNKKSPKYKVLNDPVASFSEDNMASKRALSTVLQQLKSDVRAAGGSESIHARAAAAHRAAHRASHSQ